MNKSKKKTINIYSPHPAKECYSRIKDSLPSDPRFSLMPPKTSISGFICPENFAITKKIPNNSIFKTVSDVNMLQTILRASFNTYEGGTLIHGKMGIHPFVKYILSLCFAFFFTIPIYFLFLPFLESKTTMVSSVLITIAFLIFMVALTLIFEKLSWYYSQGESDF